MNEWIRVWESCTPPGAKGLAYIALPNERGPSDQIDLNRMVFLDPLGRWSMIREAEPDRLLVQGERPRVEGGRPALGPLSLPLILVASGAF